MRVFLIGDTGDIRGTIAFQFVSEPVYETPQDWLLRQDFRTLGDLGPGEVQ